MDPSCMNCCSMSPHSDKYTNQHAHTHTHIQTSTQKHICTIKKHVCICGCSDLEKILKHIHAQKVTLDISTYTHRSNLSHLYVCAHTQSHLHSLRAPATCESHGHDSTSCFSASPSPPLLNLLSLYLTLIVPHLVSFL